MSYTKLMKWIAFSVLLGTCTVAAQAQLPGKDEIPEQDEIDRTQLNSLGDKEFKWSSLAAGKFSEQASSLSPRTFQGKESSLFSKKQAPGFAGSVPLKMATLDKEFKTGEFTQFDRNSSFLKAQQRFESTKASPLSVRTLAAESEKTVSLRDKQYQGREADIIKRHLNELQQQQFDKLDLDDVALSVEQIREMLNKE